MSKGFGLVLDGGVDAGRDARRAIAAGHPSLPMAVQDDLSLLVTELVTNAVRHGGAAPDHPIRLECWRRNGLVRVEVIDAGTDFQEPAPPEAGDSAGGWGLFLVDQIAQRWGVSPGTPGTCVWFEVPAGAPP